MKSRQQRVRDTERPADTPRRQGDVLGISDTAPDDGAIPKPVRPGRRSPAGLEIRQPATGSGDVPQRSGATGIDMGAAGEGTDVTDRPSRPRSAPTGDENE